MHVMVAHTPDRLTSWKDIFPSDLIVNIADLNDLEHIWFAQQRSRGSHIIQQRAQFDQGKIYYLLGHHGFFYVEHIMTPEQFFSLQSTEYVNELSATIDRARVFFDKRNETMTAGEKRRIYTPRVRGGWLVFASNEDGSIVCLFSSLGLLSNAAKPRASGEFYDTFFHFRDCSERRTMDEAEAFLKGLKLVSSGQA